MSDDLPEPDKPVNQMIRGFPDIRFAVVFIGSLEEEYGEAKYELPDNIVHFERHYLYSTRRAPEIKKVEGDAATFAVVEEMHRYFRAPHAHRRSAYHAGLVTARQGVRQDRDGARR